MNYTGEYEFEFDDSLGGYSAKLIEGCEELVFPCEHDGHKVFYVWTDDDVKNQFLVKRVVVPDGILFIENSLFECFFSLETIEIPASVKLIEANAFTCCASLKRFLLDPMNPYYSVIDGHLYSKDGTRLICLAFGRVGTYFELPEGVKTIESAAFTHSKIQELVLPEGLIEIEEHAFLSCKSLQRVLLPSSVQKIGDFAFSYCESLEAVFIPDTVEEIGLSVFFESNQSLNILCESPKKRQCWDSHWADDFKVVWGVKRD